jgi:hypothetical protein
VLALGLVVDLSTHTLTPNRLGGYIQMSNANKTCALVKLNTLFLAIYNRHHPELTHSSRLANFVISCKSNVIEYLGSNTNIEALGANTYICV